MTLDAGQDEGNFIEELELLRNELKTFSGLPRAKELIKNCHEGGWSALGVLEGGEVVGLADTRRAQCITNNWTCRLTTNTRMANQLLMYNASPHRMVAHEGDYEAQRCYRQCESILGSIPLSGARATVRSARWCGEWLRRDELLYFTSPR